MDDGTFTQEFPSNILENQYAMRIGLVIDTWDIGGAETMVFEIATLLKRHGEEPVLLHFDSPYVKNYCEQQHIEQHIIPNHHYYKKMLLLPMFALKGRRFITELRLDCLHAHLYGPIIAFAPLARLIKLPFVGTLHDVYMVADAPYRRWLLRMALVLKTKLLTVSKPMQSFYQLVLKAKTDDIIYLPNCAAINPDLGHRNVMRTQLNLAPDDLAIFSVGRLVALKRFDILVSAMAELKDKTHIKAFIVGNGPEQGKLKDLVNQYQIGQTVTFLGERNDVSRLLSAADLFTLTSETEGMSKSILEALASSLPIIATDVGGNQELVIVDNSENERTEYGGNGILMNTHDPAKLAEYILQLAINKPLRLSMGKNSKQLIISEYNPELFLERHLSIYRQACNN